MKRIAFSVVFLWLGLMCAFAQEELFKVLVNKGKNTADNKPIFAGSKIYPGQTIHILDGGYLAIIYKNGKSMELKTAGVYKVIDLEKQALASSGSFSKKYAELVVNEITKSNVDITEDRKKNMSVTGSVDRAIDGPIKVISPKNSDLLAQEIKVKWQKDSSNTKGYVVKLKDMFDEPLKTYETADTFVVIKVAELGLTKNKSFIFAIEPKEGSKGTGNAPEGKLVKVLEGKRADDLNKELKLVKAEAGDESALSQIILASFCEQNKLYLEAINYYEKAIQTEPTVEEYRFAYLNFLDRIAK